MIDLSASPEQREQIVEYLAAHFPPNDRRSPTLAQGDAEVAFTEWVVPTLGQRSRDPVEAPDGSIWWAGQWSNLVGRINPSTGEMREYPLPDGAKPHTVTIDRDGNVWYTGNGNGTIGQLDPKTGEITVFTMPATMELTEIKLPLQGTTVRRLDIAADGTIWYVNSS